MIFLNRKPDKIFCLSMQRTGTTSVGKFFKDHKYKVANYNISRKNNWAQYWSNGDFESIFKSNDFKKNVVFEDDPWWFTDFLKCYFIVFQKQSLYCLLEIQIVGLGQCKLILKGKH